MLTVERRELDGLLPPFNLLSTDAAGVDTWERAQVFLARNDVEPAARATFWLAMTWSNAARWRVGARRARPGHRPHATC